MRWTLYRFSRGHHEYDRLNLALLHHLWIWPHSTSDWNRLVPRYGNHKNIEQTGGDAYQIELATADFGPEDLPIEFRDGLVMDTGKKSRYTWSKDLFAL